MKIVPHNVIPVAPTKEHVENFIPRIQRLHDIAVTVNDCRPGNYRGSNFVNLGHTHVDLVKDRYQNTA